MQTRRSFLKKMAFTLGSLPLASAISANTMKPKMTDKATSVSLYRAVNGTPTDNLSKVIEMIGGIDNLIEADDVVVIKPNVQWWNHGVPNIAALNEFVELVMNRPGGFNGEVVLGENVHRGSEPWNYAGWTQSFFRNSNLLGIHNYNDLARRLRSIYGDRFTTCHWINVDSGGRRVYDPVNGSGYVYCDGNGGMPLIEFENGLNGGDYRKTIMTYPVFKTNRGTLIDFKNGIHVNNSYNTSKLKYINFAAINHHSTWCGISSSVKNYLGVTDLSGGPDPHKGGKLTDSHYNFHSFPFDKWAPGPKPGMIGAEIGVFLSTIRKADLNVVTAEWVGLANRVDPPVAHTRAVIGCTDPVALDYHTSKYILHANSKVMHHDPDNPKSPTHQYLKACAEHGGGIIDERRVSVRSYDFKHGRYQKDDELFINAEKEWGTNLRAIAKYLVLRYGSFLL